MRDSLILKLAAIAGLRPGQIFGLQWGDITVEGLRITCAVYRGIVQTPKTHHSVRIAAISNTIRDDLESWRTIAPNTASTDSVFPAEHGRTPTGYRNYWRRHVKPTLDKLHINGITFQVLRRSCASLLNGLGIDGKLVADQLGHSLNVSQNVYTKVGIQRPQEAITQLDAALASTEQLRRVS